MKGLWSLFDCIPSWKRQLVLIATLTGLGGMLWQANDLIDENGEHPLISPAASYQKIQYDEYGDPLALAKRPKPLPYAKLWASPATQLAFTFILTLVIGSLIRSLFGGSLALIVIVLITVLIATQGAVFSYFDSEQSLGVASEMGRWLMAQMDQTKEFLLQSLPAVMAAIAGAWIGLTK